MSEYRRKEEIKYMSEELIHNFKQLIRHAMMYAQYSHDYVFDNTLDKYVAVSYLNIAAAKFAAAESLYYSRFEELQRGEAEDLFQLFDTYLRELLNNFRTGHSHQWTDIEFERLKNCFDYSVFAFNNK